MKPLHPSTRIILWTKYCIRGALLAGLLLASGCATNIPSKVTITTARAPADAPEPFLAGVGKFDITPSKPKGLIMGGFGWRKKAVGVKHRMYARALILERGSFKCALVAVPLTGLMRDSVEKIKAGIPDSVIKDNHLIIASTHSHSAPDTVGFWGVPFDGKDKTYMKEVATGIRKALELASANMVPAEVGYGSQVFDATDFISNKNIINLIDPELVVLDIRKASDHTPFATLLEIACHPEAARRPNKLLTPDFPHHAIAKVEAAFPGTTAIYVSGALGAMMSPQKKPGENTDDENMWPFVERIGNKVGDTAVAAVRGIPSYDASPELGMWNRPVFLKNTNFKYKVLRCLGISKRPVYRHTGIMNCLTGKVLSQYWKSEVNMWKVNDFRIASVPGELTPDIGLLLKKESTGSTTMIVGLANDELGYLLPEREANMGYYSYERGLNINAGAGEHVRYELETLGRLSNTPHP
ncbi:MAG: hypothetical protein ACI97B_004568 [Verrucomicrobiales bacterium]|jgi:hypothetical protein